MPVLDGPLQITYQPKVETATYEDFNALWLRYAEEAKADLTAPGSPTSAAYSQLLSSSFNPFSLETVQQTPYTSLWVATSPNPGVAHAYESASNWVRTQYGESALIRYQLQLLPPEQRAAAELWLRQQGEFNKSFLGALSHQDLPQATLEEYEKLIPIIASDDYASVLTDQQKKALDDAIAFGAEGILGQPTNLISLSAEGARQNPAQALAAFRYVQERAPGTNVGIGNMHMFRMVLEGLGAAADVGAAPLSVAARYAAAGAQELGERTGAIRHLDDLLAQEQELQQALESTTLTEDQRKDTRAVLELVQTQIAQQSEVGPDGEIRERVNWVPIDQAFREAVNPQIAGLAIGESLALGAGMRPTDEGWFPSVAITSFIAGAFIDPILVLGRVSRGTALAKKYALPLDVAEAGPDAVRAWAGTYTRSVITRRALANLAQRPEELIASGVGIRTSERAFEMGEHIALGVKGEMAVATKAAYWMERGLPRRVAVSMARATDAQGYREAWVAGMIGASREGLPFWSRHSGLLQKAQEQLDRLRELRGRQVNETRFVEQVDPELLRPIAEFPERLAGRGRTPEQLAELRASIQAEGVREPLTVLYSPETGKMILEEGHHRLGAALDVGTGTVPVEFRVVDDATIRARATVSPVQTPPQLAPTLSRIVEESRAAGRHLTPDELAELQTLERAELSLRANRAFEKTIVNAVREEMPLRHIPKSERRILAQAFFPDGPKGSFQEMFHGLLTHYDNLGDTKMVSLVRRALADHPAGTIFDHSTGKPIGELDDWVEQSVKHIHDLGVYFKVPLKELRAKEAAYLRIGAPGAQTFQQWWSDYKLFLTERSRNMNPLMKEWFRFTDYTHEMTEQYKGFVGRNPTLFETVDGFHEPISAFMAQARDRVYIPTRRTLSEMTSLSRRVLRYATRPSVRRRAPSAPPSARARVRGGGAALTAWDGMSLFTDWFVEWWKRDVLIGKGFALPMRIQLEQLGGRIPISGERAGAARLAERGVVGLPDDIRTLGAITDFEPAAVERGSRAVYHFHFDDVRPRDDLGKVSNYARGMADGLAQYASDQLAVRLLRDGPEDALEWLRSPAGTPYYNFFKATVRRSQLSELDELAILRQGHLAELENFIGTGPFADDLRQAILNQRFARAQDIEDAIAEARNRALARATARGYDADQTRNFVSNAEERVRRDAATPLRDAERVAEIIQQQIDTSGGVARAIDWTPPRQISGYQYAPRSNQGRLRRMSDAYFKNIVSQPDLKWSRYPVFRDIADREYARLRAMGWSESRARGAAQTYGARRVSELLYDLGRRTNLQWYLRRTFPFGAAFQELGETWLYHLPATYGSRNVGRAVMLRHAQRFGSVLEATQQMYSDPATGEPYIQIPGARFILSLMGFDNATLRTRAQGLNILGNFFPGLGPLKGAAVGSLAKATNYEKLRDFGDFLLPFGLDVQLAPTAVNTAWVLAQQLAGSKDPSPPFWEFFSSEHTQLLMDWARDDAMNIAARRAADTKPLPENYPKGLTDPKFRRDYRKWVDQIFSDANGIVTSMTAIRLISSIAFPGIVSMGDDYKSQMSQLWQEISLYPDGSPVPSEMLDQWAQDHPGATWYPQGKSEYITERRTYEDYSDYMQAIRTGDIVPFDPVQRGKIAAMMEIVRGIRKQRDDLMASFGTWGNALANWDAYQEDFDALLREEDSIIAWNLGDKPGTPTGFDTWWDRVHALGKDTSEDFYQAQLMSEILRDINLLPESVYSENGIRDPAFADVRRTLTGKLDELRQAGDENSTRYSEFTTGINWYFDNVLEPFLDKRDGVWTRINALASEADPDRGRMFAELTRLANSTKGGKHKGVPYPSPEEFLFVAKGPEERRNTLIQWATRPPEWLSNFSFATTYANVPHNPKKLGKLFQQVAEWEADFEQWAADNFVSSSSNLYKDRRSLLDLQEMALAQELGLSKVWELRLMTPAERILSANLTRNQTFADYARRAHDVNALFDLTRRTSGGVPTMLSGLTYATFAADLDRDMNRDPMLKNFLETMAIALGEDFDKAMPLHDMYQRIFFDYWGPPKNLPQLQAG